MHTSKLPLHLFISAIISVAFTYSKSSPVVDLDYGVYKGYFNSTSGLNIFKGYGRLSLIPLYVNQD